RTAATVSMSSSRAIRIDHNGRPHKGMRMPPSMHALRRKNAIVENALLWRCYQPRGGRKIRRDAMMWRAAAGVGCAALLLVATDASAQRRGPNYDRSVGGNDPVAHFFGFNDSGSPIARTTVSFPGDYRPGTIVIRSGERRLYLVLGNGQALRYGIGVGRD